MAGLSLLEEDNTECQNYNEDLKCTLDTGATTKILVNVRPPNNAEIKDNYTFTLSVEPVVDGEPMIVGRENIEISVAFQSQMTDYSALVCHKRKLLVAST